VLATSTTRPCADNTRVAARVVKNTESTFSRIVRRHCSSDISASAASSGIQMPELPTK
jgi:hypothetical protein